MSEHEEGTRMDMDMEPSGGSSEWTISLKTSFDIMHIFIKI